MKMIFSPLIVLLMISSLIMAHPHIHHRHRPRHGSSFTIRNRASPADEKSTVATIYMLNGQNIEYDKVETCLRESKCILAGHNVRSTLSSVQHQTVTPSPQSTTFLLEKTLPPTTSRVSKLALPDLSTPITIHSMTPAPLSNSSAPEPEAAFDTEHPRAASIKSIGKNFPNGQIDCSQFPSQYGPVSADWIGLGGWTGVQKTPGYSVAENNIGYIQTAIAGEGCSPGSFCSYACPPGYQKSQWPAAQGSTGQSIGGLYCNKNGKLELSRTVTRQLCTPGVGNIQVKNLLGKNVAICRTDYPGTESETIALNALPGSTVKVTCPDSREYYRNWEGEPTSAQYYINPSGHNVQEACTWGTANSDLGNWAPVNMGVGKGDSGAIFISLFPNIPTNPTGVLDFKIDITGDVNGHCAYRNGKFYRDDVVSPTGCTVGVNGQAFFEFSSG